MNHWTDELTTADKFKVIGMTVIVLAILSACTYGLAYIACSYQPSCVLP